MLRTLALAAVAATVVVVAPPLASACHDEPCPSERPAGITVSLLADAALVGVDLHYAVRGARPGRAYGALELAAGLIQFPLALAYGLDEGHDYETWAQIQIAAASVVAAHGIYVLIRGGQDAPDQRTVTVTPTVRSDGAGFAVTGRF